MDAMGNGEREQSGQIAKDSNNNNKRTEKKYYAKHERPKSKRA